MKHIVWLGVLFVFTLPCLAADPIPQDQLSAEDRKVKHQMEETIVSFTFVDQPLSEAFDFLSILGNLNIVLDRNKLKDPNQTVTLKLSNAPLMTAVALMADRLGLRFTILGGVVFISDEAGIKQAVADKAVDGVYTAARNASLREIKVAKPDDALAAADRDLLTKLQETVVSISFNGREGRELFDYLGTQGKVNVIVDPRVLAQTTQTVELRLANRSLDDALVLLSEQLGWKRAVRGGVVFISDTKGAVRWMAEAGDVTVTGPDPDSPQARKMRKLLTETRISFTFVHHAPAQALAYLRTATGLELGQLGSYNLDQTLNLKVKDVPLATALKLFAEQLGQRCVVSTDSVAFTPAKDVAPEPAPPRPAP